MIERTEFTRRVDAAITMCGSEREAVAYLLGVVESLENTSPFGATTTRLIDAVAKSTEEKP